MWFGNLVTMKWWNDLWLNESFAEWASTTCQAEATAVDRAPGRRSAPREKAWAYRQDQLSSTHPIVADIRDLEDVEVNFDGITYAKGASVLKQLVAYVGREPFVAGAARVLRASTPGATPRSPTCSPSSRQTSGRDLLDLVASCGWRPPASTPCAPRSTVDDAGRHHRRRRSPRPRPRATRRCARTASRSACYAVRGRRSWCAPTALELDVDGERTEVPELVGRRAARPAAGQRRRPRLRQDPPRRALARHGRWRTRAASPTSLPRSLVLGAAWDMTRDAEMPGPRLRRAACSSRCRARPTPPCCGRCSSQLQTAVTPVRRPGAPRRGAPPTSSDGCARWPRSAEPGSDAQLQLVDGLRRLRAGAGGHGVPAGAARRQHRALEGLAVDTEMRWTLLTGAGRRRCGRRRRDRGRARARQHRDRPRARRPRPAPPGPPPRPRPTRGARRSTEDGLPNQTVAAVGIGFGRAHDPQLLAPYVATYHDALLDGVDLAHPRHRRVRSSSCSTRSCWPAASWPTPRRPGWTPTPTPRPALRRLVGENRDGIARALAAQERDAARG